MFNKAILIGRLGKDPECSYTPAEKMVTKFSIATDESYKDKSGNKVQNSTWHVIICWGKLAEIAGEYLKKGALVMIEGRIQNRSYDDKNGVKRYTSEIVASTMKMLGGKQEGGHEHQPSAGQSTSNIQDHNMDEDVPF
jgi:single-strand DNA-binding protein